MSSKNDGEPRMTRFARALPYLITSRPAQISAVLSLLALALAALPRPAHGQSEPASAAETSASAPAVPSASTSAPSLPAAQRPPVRPTAALTTPATLLPPPPWHELAPRQKQALAPLERDWDQLDPAQKSKWLEMAPRFASLPEQEQTRLHERMRDWARLSPTERQQARVGFQVAQQLNTGDRQAKWEAYQALPPEKRQELADKAAQKQQAAKPRPLTGKPTTDLASGPPQPKSNLVPPPSVGLPLKPVAPSVLQAKPGASTVLITQAKTPPSHQQAGQTKIFADPELVDAKTLLPKPQAMATAPR
jgi:hypothetical protein